MARKRDICTQFHAHILTLPHTQNNCLGPNSLAISAMAWGRGAATGLDDLCVRLRANDPKLQSLTLLKHRKVDDGEIRKLCDSLQHNTCLTELYASNHAITPAAAALVAGLLGSNTTLAFLCIGNSGFGDDGVTALSPGLSSSKSLRTLDLESKV